MAISLTSDPICAAAYVSDAIELDSGDDLNHLINFASAAFLRFTGRERITSGAVQEIVSRPPLEVPVIWLRATPVDTGEDFTVTSLYEGSSEGELTSSEYALTAASGRLYLPNHTTTGGAWGYQLQIDYTGGFTTVPNDVLGGAIEFMRLAMERAKGRAGVASVSFEGMSQTLETAMISEAVRDAWWPYRVLP